MFYQAEKEDVKHLQSLCELLTHRAEAAEHEQLNLRRQLKDLQEVGFGHCMYP